MAIEATDVYRRHTELFDEEALGMLGSGELATQLQNVTMLPTADDSRTLREREGPFLVMAGSGMCSGGRILHHLANHLPDPGTMVMMVGYQGRGSIERSLAPPAIVSS